MKLLKLVAILTLVALFPLQAKSSELLTAVDEAIPAVVSIFSAYYPFDETFDPDPDSYAEYFRPFYEFFYPKEYALGSGFIISKEGHIVTNAHVVEGATHVVVTLVDQDMRVVKAQVVGIDSKTDLAVLKIQADDHQHSFPYLRFGSSDQLRIGEELALIGTPLHIIFESSVATGVVSGRNRSVGLLQVEGWLQVTALSNYGNSGGPAVNARGEVIGVLLGQRICKEGNNLTFLIPSQICKKVIPQLLESGQVFSSYLGIAIKADDATFFDGFIIPRNQGILVEAVDDDSPAASFGILEGDRIIAINGHPLKSACFLKDQLAITPPGEFATFALLRDGKQIEVAVVLGDSSKAEFL